MEENFRTLQKSTIENGTPLKIIRVPAGPLQTREIAYKTLNAEEQSWFENVSSDTVSFYLTTGYMNFIIANGIIVTAKFWREGLPSEWKVLDSTAEAVLASAFPNRRIVQVDCMPLHHDGAGLHCHSRNKPKGEIAETVLNRSIIK